MKKKSDCEYIQLNFENSITLITLMKRQAPIAAAAAYSHPVEHFLTGILSTSAGLLILSPQIPVHMLWYCWIGFQVQNDHSGYHFPIMFSPEFHDYHHLK